MIFLGFPGVLPFFQAFKGEWEPCIQGTNTIEREGKLTYQTERTDLGSEGRGCTDLATHSSHHHCNVNGEICNGKIKTSITSTKLTFSQFHEFFVVVFPFFLGEGDK